MAGLWWLMLALGVGVFIVFAVILAVGLFRSRPEPGDGDEPGTEPPGRFNAWMIGTGVAVPLVIISIVFAATVHAMREVLPTAPAGALIIEVVGHQWWWQVTYPDQGVATANEIHIPVGRDVAFRLSSVDVIHSFWVPELGGKLDMLPDRVNTLVLKADEAGEYVNRCAEFCGLQHALMTMVVVAEPKDRFDAWVAARQPPAALPATADPAARRGQEIFLGTGGCATCHTVRGTSATGTRGPDLTHLASRPTLGTATLPNTAANRSRWVSDPHAIKRGVLMPAATLGREDLDAVLAYLGTLR